MSRMPEGLGDTQVASIDSVMPQKTIAVDALPLFREVPPISHFASDGSSLRNPDEVVRDFASTTQFFVGEAPNGQQAVFGVSPRFDAIPEQAPPSDSIRAIQTEQWAQQLGAAGAAIQARENGQITQLQAEQIFGGDPYAVLDKMHAAYESWKAGPNKVPESVIEPQPPSPQAEKHRQGVFTWLPILTQTSDSGHTYRVSVNTKIARAALIGGAISSLPLAACVPIGEQPTAVVVTSTQESQPTIPSPTATATEVIVRPTSTPESGTPVGEPYPATLTEFASGPEVSGVFQNSQGASDFLLLQAYGVSVAPENSDEAAFQSEVNSYIKYMETIQKLDGTALDMSQTDTVAILHNNTWGVGFQDRATGKFYMPAIKNADGTYQIVASLSLYDQYTDPNFDDTSLAWVLADNPPGIEGKQVMGANGKWFILGYVNGQDKLVAWQNLGKAPNSWVDFLGNPIIAPTPTQAPTETPPPTETPAPEVYKIEPVSVLPVQATVNGVAVNFSITIDKTLATRPTNPYTQLGFVDGFIDDKGHTPAESNEIAAYYGMYFAWKLNDSDQRDARKNVSFEAFMQRVTSENVVLLLPVDDMRDPDSYHPEWKSVDVNKFRGIVLVDKNKNTLFKDMGMGLDVRGGGVGIHFFADGGWEIWTHIPDDAGSNLIGQLGDIAAYMAKGYMYLSTQSYADPLTYQDGIIYDNLNALKMYELDGKRIP